MQQLMGNKTVKHSKKEKPEDLATIYNRFGFWWEGAEVVVRAPQHQAGRFGEPVCGRLPRSHRGGHREVLQRAGRHPSGPTEDSGRRAQKMKSRRAATFRNSLVSS